VLVDEVPAPRAHEQRRGLLAQPVLATVRPAELDGALDRVDEVHLAVGDVGPGRRERVLEVRHEAPRAGVQGVDDHLAVDRPRDLDAAVAQVRRRRGDLPVALADLARLGQEVQALPRGHPASALRPRGQQLAATGIEPAVQLRDEGQRLGGQDLLLAGPPAHGSA
jgi:hypothetical protein